jgi:biopolymer transport protein ExbB
MSEPIAAPDGAPVEFLGSDNPASPSDATIASQAAEPASTIDVSSLVDLLAAGGPVTAILLVISVVALTVMLAKLWQFASAGVGRRHGLSQALDLWVRGNDDAALERVARASGPAARVTAHAMGALAAGFPEDRVREDTERLALGELLALRSNLSVIEITVQIAPLLGLFGTVLGMIASFQALQGAGAQADPAVLAGGIWVALLTTAVGLAIAIPAALALAWFQGRIERERSLIEDAATSVFTRRLKRLDPRAPGDGQAPPAWRIASDSDRRTGAL